MQLGRYDIDSLRDDTHVVLQGAPLLLHSATQLAEDVTSALDRRWSLFRDTRGIATALRSRAGENSANAHLKDVNGAQTGCQLCFNLR